MFLNKVREKYLPRDSHIWQEIRRPQYLRVGKLEPKTETVHTLSTKVY